MSFFALLVLLPALLVIGVLVKLSSPGPALFRQRRIGENGKVFTMYKFPTMTTDAPTAPPVPVALLIWGNRGAGRTILPTSEIILSAVIAFFIVECTVGFHFGGGCHQDVVSTKLVQTSTNYMCRRALYGQ